MFKGDRNNFGTEQLSKMEAEKLKSNIRTPDFTKDNLETGKISEGGAIYNTYCGACHQFNGMGSPGRFPPLAGAEWVTGDKSRLIGVILNGLSGSIKVKGAPYDGVMPAHAFLKDSEIAAVLTYIRSNFGNQASPVSSNEVGALRHKE